VVGSVEQTNAITDKKHAVAIKYAKAKFNVLGINLLKRYSNPLKLERHSHNKQTILDFGIDRLEVLEYFGDVKVLNYSKRVDIIKQHLDRSNVDKDSLVKIIALMAVFH
jgi:hypothetical protein